MQNSVKVLARKLSQLVLACRCLSITTECVSSETPFAAARRESQRARARLDTNAPSLPFSSLRHQHLRPRQQSRYLSTTHRPNTSYVVYGIIGNLRQRTLSVEQSSKSLVAGQTAHLSASFLILAPTTCHIKNLRSIIESHSPTSCSDTHAMRRTFHQKYHRHLRLTLDKSKRRHPSDLGHQTPAHYGQSPLCRQTRSASFTPSQPGKTGDMVAPEGLRTHIRQSSCTEHQHLEGLTVQTALGATGRLDRLRPFDYAN